MTKTLAITEFGRAIQASKELFKDEPLPTEFNQKLELTVSSNMWAALSILNSDFEKAKAQYFPNWKEATYVLKEGPETFITIIVREDGEDVPEDVYDAWYAWYSWNEYDEDSPDIQPTFTYPEGYATKKKYHRNFAWYTQAPVEELE